MALGPLRYAINKRRMGVWLARVYSLQTMPPWRARLACMRNVSKKPRTYPQPFKQPCKIALLYWMLW